MRCGHLIGDVVLARRFPDRAVDRGQVVDVDFLGVFFRELDHRRLEAEHIVAAVGQRRGRRVAHAIGALVGQVDAQPVRNQSRLVARRPHQDAELGALAHIVDGQHVLQRRGDHVVGLLVEAVLQQHVLERAVDGDDALGPAGPASSADLFLGMTVTFSATPLSPPSVTTPRSRMPVSAGA